MADYSERESREARRIVDRLLASQHEPPDIEGALAVSDVESDAAEFAEELQLLDEVGVDARPFALATRSWSQWPYRLSSGNLAVLSIVRGRSWPSVARSPLFSRMGLLLRPLPFRKW